MSSTRKCERIATSKSSPNLGRGGPVLSRIHPGGDEGTMYMVSRQVGVHVHINFYFQHNDSYCLHPATQSPASLKETQMLGPNQLLRVAFKPHLVHLDEVFALDLLIWRHRQIPAEECSLTNRGCMWTRTGCADRERTALTKSATFC